MRVSSIELQLQIADILTVLEETGGIPKAMLVNYFKFASNDIIFSNFQDFRETAIVKYLFAYYKNKFVDLTMTEADCTSKFAGILSNIYTYAGGKLATSQDVYKLLLLYALRLSFDGVAASGILIQLNEMMNKTDNTVLKMGIKRALLDFYLQHPVKHNAEIKKMSQEIKSLNTDGISQIELDIKSFL